MNKSCAERYISYLQDCKKDKKEILKKIRELKRDMTKEQFQRYLQIKNVLKNILNIHVWDVGELMIANFIYIFIKGRKK